MLNLENISRKIKKVRLEKKLSQQRFGSKLNISGKSISAYESGRSVPPLKILEKLDTVYDTNFVSENTTQQILEQKIESLKSLVHDIELTLGKTLTL